MRRVPGSLLIGLRDIAALTAVAFVGATAVDAACTRLLQREYAAHTWPDGTAMDAPFVWSQVAQTGWQWARGVVVWLAVCWCATRARALLRTVWLPVTTGLVIVGLRTALPLLGATAVPWDAWPGPAIPYSLADMWDSPTLPRPTLLHPAWGFPLLLAALLVAAAVLGARSGRRPDDSASRRVAPVSRRGAPIAAVIVGVPALGAIAGALLAWHASAGADDLIGSSQWAAAANIWVAPLAVAILACALLSGAGPVGGALAAIVTVLTAGPPVLAWMSGPLSTTWFELSSYTALGVPAGMVVACAAAALWRPAAAWGGEALTWLGSPLAQPSPLPPPLADDGAAR